MAAFIFTTTEYAYLIADDIAARLPHVIENKQCFIPTNLWAVLHDMAQANFDEDGSSRFIEVASPDPQGRARLQLKSKVGLLLTAKGGLEVLPKIANLQNSEKSENSQNPQQLRTALGLMLSTLNEVEILSSLHATPKQSQGTIFDSLITAFLQQVQLYVQQGMVQNILNNQSNTTPCNKRVLLRGKTNNCPANFNEGLAENLPNQLIKQALKKVVLLSGLSQHKIKVQQLLIAFNEVPNCTVKAETLRAWQHSVGQVHQQYLKKLTAVILGPFSQQATTSSPAIDAYMYPAEILFERYVARQLEEVLNTSAPAIRQKPAKASLAHNSRQNIEIKCQEQVQSLFQKQTGPFAKTYALRPDIVIRKKSTNQQDKPAVLIMDTKWKTYTEQNNAVAQADLYQMLAYGSYYLGNETNSTLQLAIIAPATAFLNSITGPHLYAVQGNTIELWMLPFDLLKPQGCFVKSQIPSGLLGEVLGRCWQKLTVA